MFLGCSLSGLRKLKLITFSNLGEYLCVGLFFFFSKSKEMQIKNRTMVNWVNLVKLYLGYVLLQSVLFLNTISTCYF